MDIPLTVDNTAPTVSVAPSGTAVAQSTQDLVLTFSEAIDITTAETVTMSPAKITGGAIGVSDIRWNSPDNTVLNIPLDTLDYNTPYTVNISGFQDLVGHVMEADNGNTLYIAVYGLIDYRPYMVGRTFETYEQSSFTDVPSGVWYTNYVNFGASAGIASGYDDGTFRPTSNITRAEFATMIFRYLGLELTTDLDNAFSNIAGNWAERHINALAKANIIQGYGDGTYRPNQVITREEAVKIINTAIGRAPSETQIDSTIDGYDCAFKDVNEGMWSYYDILEATVPHVSADFHAGK